MIESRRGNNTEASKLLEIVRTYDLGLIVGTSNNYKRERVYLNLMKGSEAAVEFQTIIDRRGIDPFNPERALSYLGLARAAALAGDVSRSRRSYQDFFALWKDLPVLIEAKKEYERLR